MNPPRPPSADPLDRLIDALVDWGAVASQIVAHMESFKATGASRSSRSTVDTFRRLLHDLLAPALAGREHDFGPAAELIAQIEAVVADEIFPSASPTNTAAGVAASTTGGKSSTGTHVMPSG